MNPRQRTMGFTGLALTCLLICGAPHFHRFVPIVSDRRRRMAIQVGCVLATVLCGILLLKYLLPHLTLTAAEWIISVLWLVVPFAAIMGMAYALEDAAARHS